MPPSAQAATQAARAIALKSNEHTAAYFIASMLGLMATIILSHWVGEILRGPVSKNRSPLLRPFISTARQAAPYRIWISLTHSYRSVRGALLLKIPGFTSFGHACVFTLYLAINITLMFQNLHGHLPGNFAKRMGW